MTAPAQRDGADLYIHVPFCRRICAYCVYPAELLDGDLAERYIAALEKDADRTIPSDLEPVTLAVGGGTPSSLPARELARLLELTRRWTDRGKERGLREFTFEVNPEDVTERLLDELCAAGVTRLSLGIQSLVDAELRALDRTHDAARALAAVDLCLDAGDLDVSADVLTGIAGQTRTSLHHSLDHLVDRGVGHLEIFGLDPDEPGAATEPPWTPRERRELLSRWAADRGFEQYELNALARPGRESAQRVRRAWSAPLYALGAGAVARIGDRSIRRVIGAGAYIDRVSRETSPTIQPEATSSELRSLERAMAGLHLRDGVVLESVPARLRIALEDAQADGWIDVRATREETTDNGPSSGVHVRLSVDGWLEPDRALQALVEAMSEDPSSRAM